MLARNEPVDLLRGKASLYPRVVLLLEFRIRGNGVENTVHTGPAMPPQKKVCLAGKQAAVGAGLEEQLKPKKEL